MDCIINDYKMPSFGLYSCSYFGHIDWDDLELFRPKNISAISYWASGSRYDMCHRFTPLRQTIVLLMAAINNEL
jgi:hypothetical protein